MNTLFSGVWKINNSLIVYVILTNILLKKRLVRLFKLDKKIQQLFLREYFFIFYCKIKYILVYQNWELKDIYFLYTIILTSTKVFILNGELSKAHISFIFRPSITYLIKLDCGSQ